MGFGIKIIIRHEGNDEGDLKIKLGLLASVTIFIFRYRSAMVEFFQTSNHR
jgi:hypothetical protein